METGGAGLAGARFYAVHLRTLIACAAASLFVAVWWWAAGVTSLPALSPLEAVAGKRVAIDAGHGGVDPGAVGQGGTLEKEVVLDIALKLKPLFEQAGIDAAMTREEDKDLGDGTGTLREQKRADLAARVALANGSGADVFISLHANSFPSPQWSGAQTFYFPGRSESESLAIAIQAELVKMSPGNSRRARPGEYFVLEHADMPAAVVEVGFLSNPTEEELLRDPEYREKIAEAIFRGVVRFLAQRAAWSEPDGR